MAGLVTFLSRVLTTNPMIQSNAVTKARTSSNPFSSSSGNPFVYSQSSNPFVNYGQNKPVVGGYFAGYYNNQPNIVGRRLFIEV